MPTVNNPTVELSSLPYIDESQAAELSRCCKRVIQQARYDLEITYYTRGKKIIYKPKDVIAWNEKKLECVKSVITKTRRRK